MWPRVAKLPLVVESLALEPLEAELGLGFERVTTHVRLAGAGADGLGEDISPMPGEHEALHETEPSLSLAGEWTLESFCEHLATQRQWPAPPSWEAGRLYRNWAFESAALDLALRQAGLALHEALELEPRPVRFVNSLGLGDPPSIDTIRRRLDRYPELRFKLDADPAWTPSLMAELAATGSVDTIDFKGHYEIEVKDDEALMAMYENVLAAFPDALLEDPHDHPEVERLLRRHLERVSYDAPIHEIADIDGTPLPARTFNVKPSRTGGLRPLLALYAYCEAKRLQMYGGGMGELGVGRGQIQLLASLFHADAPNDVAPVAFNEPDPPEGLPSSPLSPSPSSTGFRAQSARS